MKKNTKVSLREFDCSMWIKRVKSRVESSEGKTAEFPALRSGGVTWDRFVALMGAGFKCEQTDTGIRVSVVVPVEAEAEPVAV